ncbi:fimbria/pilus outer membrane usher protein [Escherichia coli]
MTVYGGVQGSEHYKAGLGGLAVAAPFGAISADITHARSELDDTGYGEENRRGESYRVSYSKNITETRSHFALAAYRFSTHGYMDYLTTMQTRDAISKSYDANTIRRNKSRYSLTVTQGLPGNWGEFYLSSSIQNYWNTDDTDKQYQLGYSNYWNRISYSVNAGRSWSAVGRSQDTVSLSLSFPLGSTQRSPIGHFSYNSSSGGSENWRTGISGSAGEEHQFSYGMSATTGNQGVGTSGAVNAQYISPWTSVNAAYSNGRHYSSISGGLNGTMIGHSDGVTLSPYQGDTFALVEAKGAEGAKVSGYSNTRIDSRGYAAVPYLSPYQMNDVRVDLKGSAAGVELDSSSQKVAPHEGAVVKVSYQTRQGRPLLITVTGPETPLSFGSEVYDEAGNVVGYVGQGGQIYARVEQNSGILTVNSSNSSQQVCQFNYQLPNEKQSRAHSLETFIASCHKTT